MKYKIELGGEDAEILANTLVWQLSNTALQEEWYHVRIIVLLVTDIARRIRSKTTILERFSMKLQEVDALALAVFIANARWPDAYGANVLRMVQQQLPQIVNRKPHRDASRPV